MNLKQRLMDSARKQLEHVEHAISRNPERAEQLLNVLWWQLQALNDVAKLAEIDNVIAQVEELQVMLDEADPDD